MADEKKPGLSDEDKAKIREYLKEFDDQRRMAMLKWWHDWKESVMASPTSHAFSVALAVVSTKWLVPLIMKWIP